MSFIGKPGFSALLNVGLAQSLGVKHLYMLDEPGSYLRDLVGTVSATAGSGVTVQAGTEGIEYFVNGGATKQIGVSDLGSDPANIIVIARVKVTAAPSAIAGAIGFGSSSAAKGFYIGVSTDASPKLGAVFHSNGGPSVVAYNTVSTNTYYTVAVQCSNTSVMYTWINGQPVTTGQGSTGPGATITGLDSINFFSRWSGSAALGQFKGDILWAAVLAVPATPMPDDFFFRLYAEDFPYNLFQTRGPELWTPAASNIGVGAASGTGTATGIGASIVNSVGSSSGVGAASGVGASTVNAVGAASGTGSATGIGASRTQGVGAANGIGAASGVGASLVNSVGSCSSIGAATGIAASTVAGVGSSAGNGAASGISSSIANSVGSATGIGTADGISLSSSAGSASGVGTATGIAKSICSSVGAASGIGTATGVSDGATSSVGAASGTGAAAGSGASTCQSTGISAGISSVIGVSSVLVSGVGDANGNSTVSGAAASFVNAIGLASGIGAANANSSAISESIGAAFGTGNAVGFSVNPPQGLSGGTWKAGNRGVSIAAKARSVAFTR